MARFVFKHGDWTSVTLRINNLDYAAVKELLKTAALSSNDPERAVAQFLSAYARSEHAFDDDIEVLGGRDLSDYFTLTDNYRLFSADRVDALCGEDVYLVILNENEDNIRTMLFESGAKPRWFTVKR